MIWQVPDQSLPFTSDHYERFLGGIAGSRSAGSSAHPDRLRRQLCTGRPAHGINRYRIGVQQTKRNRRRAVRHDFSGVLERYPKLKVVSVENEIGWMPFLAGAMRQRPTNAIAIRKKSR